jgi:RND family efflux transporter MFP subunit
MTAGTVSVPVARRGVRGPVVGGVLLLVVAVGLGAWGISTRTKALTTVASETSELNVPTVAVTTPKRAAPTQDLVLPGTLQPFVDASIYARTTGYLRKWAVDIGSHVTTGQVLAEIDTPEIDQQLDQARADLATAEATARLARVTAERYRELIKTESVSQQDLDNANGNLEARGTAVESARANVKRLEQLHAFGRLTAPFDGVITARNTDIGALVDSGSNAKELFHMAAVDRLRVFVNVPQAFSQAARVGLRGELTLAELPGRRFAGTLARTSQAIDVASRTLLAEFDIANPHGELLPGAYAEVHFHLPGPATTFTLGADTLLFRADGLRVATVTQGHVALRPITVGRDFGNTVEILAGLRGDEAVVVNPADSLESGQAVEVVPPTPAAGR